MALLLKNNAISLLAASISKTDVTVRVLAGHGVRFPLPAEAGDWFPLALTDVRGNIEYLRATARSGDAITVLRGQEGTQALSYSAGDLVDLRLTLAALEALDFGGGSGGNPLVSIEDMSIEAHRL